MLSSGSAILFRTVAQQHPGMGSGRHVGESPTRLPAPGLLAAEAVESVCVVAGMEDCYKRS
jgi:hypothetical protein